MYKMTNKQTGEVTMVVAKELGQDYADFIPADSIAGEEPIKYRFSNIGQVGDLKSDEYDIEEVKDSAVPEGITVDEPTVEA